MIERIFTLTYRLPPAQNATMHSYAHPSHQYKRELTSLMGPCTLSFDPGLLDRELARLAQSIFTLFRQSSPSYMVYQGLAQPPATSTHSARQDPCFPSTSTISVSHLHLHPTPFSLTGSHESQYSSSSLLFFSSNVVISRNGCRGIWRAGAFAGQCWIVVCR
jgi:hypothetical protein